MGIEFEDYWDGRTAALATSMLYVFEHCRSYSVSNLSIVTYLDISVSRFGFRWVGSKCVEIKSKSRVGRASRTTLVEDRKALAFKDLCPSLVCRRVRVWR
jgi:hypothetical protein